MDRSVEPSTTRPPEGDAHPSPHPTPPERWPHFPGYVVTGELARGGMGRVYAARDGRLNREVAVKTLLPGADPTRFVVEARITARLPHPGVPPVHALGLAADGAPYLVMKRIRGHTLAAWLDARRSPADGRADLLQVFEQVCQAVGFAHSRGVIHRDLKPANVMVGMFAEAVKDWDRAVSLSDRGADAGARAARAVARVRAGQVSEAVAEVDELRQWNGWDAARWYAFAGVYAVAAATLADQKDTHADRAVEVLRKAVRAGFNDAKRLREDKDLAPLRDRDDFKELVAGLEKKAPR